MLKSNPSNRGAMLLMALTVTLWGFSWIIMKHLSSFIGPFDLVMARYALAFLVLFAILLVTRQSLKLPPFWLTLGIAVFQRSEEHTSELQSLMRISYAVFCLHKKTHMPKQHTETS